MEDERMKQRLIASLRRQRTQRIVLVAVIIAGCAVISASVVISVIVLSKVKYSGEDEGSSNSTTDDSQNNNPPQPNSTIPAITTPNYALFQQANKQLYVWSHSTVNKIQNKPAWTLLIQNVDQSFDKLISFCKAHNFSKIYLFTGSVEWEYDDYFSKGMFPYQQYLVNDLVKLKQNGIQVELTVYLNDQPNNMMGYQRAEDVAKAALALQQHSEFIGLHWDQEPSQIESYHDLLQMLRLSAKHIKTSSTLKPLWLGQTVQECLTAGQISGLNISDPNQTFAQLVTSLCDSSALMAYSNSYAKIDNYMEQMQAIAAAAAKSGVNIIETGFINALPEEETLCYEFKKDPSAFYKYVADKSSQYSTVVLHDYSQFYFNLYCTDAASNVNIENWC